MFGCGAAASIIWKETCCLLGQDWDSRCWRDLKGAVLLLCEPSGVSLSLVFTACLTPLAGGCGYKTKNILGKAAETYGVTLDATNYLIGITLWIIFNLFFISICLASFFLGQILFLA